MFAQEKSHNTGLFSFFLFEIEPHWVGSPGCSGTLCINPQSSFCHCLSCVGLKMFPTMPGTMTCLMFMFCFVFKTRLHVAPADLNSLCSQE